MAKVIRNVLLAILPLQALLALNSLFALYGLNPFQFLFSFWGLLVVGAFDDPGDSMIAEPALAAHDKEVSRIQSHGNGLMLFGLSADEEDAAEPKGEGVDGRDLIDLGIVEMSRHVVLFAVVVDDRRLGLVLPALLQQLVEEVVGSVCHLLDRGGDWGFGTGVFAVGPVVLVADVGPPYPIVEVVLLLFLLLLYLFQLLLLLLSLLLM